MNLRSRLPRIAAISVFTILASLCALSAYAEIRLPRLISDHAVLQRGTPIHIWGWATPGAAVTVTLHQQTLPGTADRLGESRAATVKAQRPSPTCSLATSG
jgi:hypothetical protein